MTEQPFRLGDGGRIDRTHRLNFSFDGRAYIGWSGDTLASALLANGVHLVGRSFKYHRPRGIYTAGVEEPNALVSIRQGGRHEPNIPATVVELYDGLVAVSQNRWPSLQLDLMGAVDGISPVFAAGFYYKTFMAPTNKAWSFYEHFIRRAAGLGNPPTEPDPDDYEKAHAFCDVLVIGAGPSGLAAALAAARCGARVVLADDDSTLGGSLLSTSPISSSNFSTNAWLVSVVAELQGLPNVRIMTRTSVFGAYDNLVFGLLERVCDHLPEPPPFQPRQRYWTLRARQAVIATGAIERPLVFGNNDRPGVMLASATRRYLNRYAVLPGRRIVAFTNNDSAYDVALEVAAAGAEIKVVDARSKVPSALQERIREAGISLHLGHGIAGVNGLRRVKSVDLVPFNATQPSAAAVVSRLPCDLVVVSGGWTPTLHLLGQRGSKPVFDEARATLLPGTVPAGFRIAGSATGHAILSGCAENGWSEGRAAAEACGYGSADLDDDMIRDLPDKDELGDIAPVWVIPHPSAGKRRKQFVDFQNDVSVDDIALAHREGYESVEHLKRYTTLGMATDQGKTSNLNALAIMAGLRKRPIAEVGTTIYRPPYSPVTIGALAGGETGKHFRPIRRSPMQDWHDQKSAVFTDVGQWHRPRYYPKSGESLEEAYIRETAQVRAKVGIVDVSSLGKIDVQGPDAAEFLNRVYVNTWTALATGKSRYGVMLRPDGLVLDDGTTSRISEHHYFMTTTTGNAGPVMTHLEFLLQVVWPELKVHVTSVTAQWAGIAIAGPRSRDLVRRVIGGINFDNDAFPFMGVRHGQANEVPVRVLRISFSGELAYEAYIPAGHGEALWQMLFDEGQELDLVTYGSEALGALRIEKGHVAGPELDGRTSLADLGLDRMASKKKSFVGGTLMGREGLTVTDRPRLVGLEPSDPQAKLAAGAILCLPGHHEGHGLGVVTSVTYSPELGRNIGIGLLSGGLSREGELIDAVFPLRGEVTAVRIRSPHFVDPEGTRLHA